MNELIFLMKLIELIQRHNYSNYPYAVEFLATITARRDAIADATEIKRLTPRSPKLTEQEQIYARKNP